jgi:hypothetical protein
MSHRAMRAIFLGGISAWCALWILGEAHCAEVDLVRPTIVYGLGRGGDYLTTRLGQARGFREGHPVVDFVGPAPALALSTAALVGIDAKLQKDGHRGWAKALRITATVASGVGIVGNTAKLLKKKP